MIHERLIACSEGPMPNRSAWLPNWDSVVEKGVPLTSQMRGARTCISEPRHEAVDPAASR